MCVSRLDIVELAVQSQTRTLESVKEACDQHERTISAFRRDRDAQQQTLLQQQQNSRKESGGVDGVVVPIGRVVDAITLRLEKLEKGENNNNSSGGQEDLAPRLKLVPYTRMRIAFFYFFLLTPMLVRQPPFVCLSPFSDFLLVHASLRFVAPSCLPPFVSPSFMLPSSLRFLCS